MVHGARHILMLMPLYRYIISVNKIRQKCWKINFICDTNLFDNVHRSSQIFTRLVKRGQFCMKNKTHGYEIFTKTCVKTRRHGAAYDAGITIGSEKSPN